MTTDDDHAVPRRQGNTRVAAKRQLQGILDSVAATTQPLDLVHVTETGWAEEILRAGQIECRKCKIFDHKPLAYFFVARPAYRPPNWNEKSPDILMFPFAFVVDSNALEDPYHVYPFDTGAAATGRISGAKQPGVYLEDHELTPALDSAWKLISWAFGSNLAYFQGQIRDGLGQDVPPWDGAARGYVRMATAAGSDPDSPDRRASTIEVASSSHVSLRNHCNLVVLPDRFVEDQEGTKKNNWLLNRLQELSIKLETYRWQPNLPPDDHIDLVERLVERHLKAIGQL